MDKSNDKSDDKQQVKMQINPNMPVLYTDGVLITSDQNNFGITLNFAQNAGDTMQVVSRVGMSLEHAHNLLETLNNHLSKHPK